MKSHSRQTSTTEFVIEIKRTSDLVFKYKATVSIDEYGTSKKQCNYITTRGAHHGAQRMAKRMAKKKLKLERAGLNNGKKQYTYKVDL